METDERAQGLRGDERDIAGEDEERARDHRLPRRENGVARAAGLPLVHKHNPSLRERGPHRVAAVAHHDHDPLWGKGGRRAEDVFEEGEASERMEDLRAVGTHARPLARRQDHCIERVVHRPL
jgi:hypothetical protein